MTDHATPANREATPTPDGRTIDLLIEAFEYINNLSDGDLRDRIRAHLLELAREGELFHVDEPYCARCEIEMPF